MKRFGNIFFFILSLFVAFACGNEEQKPVPKELMIQGQAQGTTYTIKYVGEKLESLPAQIDTLLLLIDRSLSTYDTSSLITAFNKGDTILPERLFSEMLEFSAQLNLETGGAFDPSIGPLIKSWGWGFSNAEEMDSSKVDSLLELKGFDKFYLSEKEAYLIESRAKLNFNAIAQGYSVDLLAEHLDQLGIRDYYIELGGEIIVRGLKPDSTMWRIGIDQPVEGNENRDLSAILRLQDKAMATSGNYRKYYEKDGKKYTHTIDPSTGFPVRHHLLSATVVSDQCYRADALATAFMVMGYEKAVRFLNAHPNDQAFLVYSNDSGGFGYYISPALEGQFEKVE